MPNIDQPSGLRPVRYLNGAPYDGKHNLYLITGNNAAVFVGDAVVATASGGAAGTRVNGLEVDGWPTVVQAAAGDVDVVGVVVGFLPDPTSLSTRHRVNNTDRIAMVCDAPDVIYEIQEDGTLGVDAAGANADLVVGTGSATTGNSAMELASASVTAATAQLRILRPVPRPDNDVASANAKWEVVINEHAYKITAGT